MVVPSRVGLSPTAAQAHAPAAVGSGQLLTTQDVYRGRARGFELHVPTDLTAQAPLVLVLHGLKQDPERIRMFSHFERLADAHGFIVAFPGGVGGSWDAGECCGSAASTGVDDLAFLDHVVALVRQRAEVDPARIYVAGYSNGAMMALRYACERPGLVAAVAVVAGSLTSSCAPTVPVAVLDLHGAKDRVVPLQGGTSRELRVAFRPVERSLAAFAAAGGDVRVQVVPGAGHIWMTVPRNGVDASDVLWDWLRDHPKPL